MIGAWARSIGAVAILALAIQPCVACLAGGGPRAASVPSHASHPTDDCGAPAADDRSHDHDGTEAPGSCPTLAASGPEIFVPAAIVSDLLVPAAPPAWASPAPALANAVVAGPGTMAGGGIPFFLRHASLRI